MNQEPKNPELHHLMTRIRRDHHKHHLKVLYSPNSLRIVDHSGKTLARVVLKDDQLLVGSGDNRDTSTYRSSPHARQALHMVYQLAWPGH